jgi:hypothetical protein
MARCKKNKASATNEYHTQHVAAAAGTRHPLEGSAVVFAVAAITRSMVEGVATAASTIITVERVDVASGGRSMVEWVAAASGGRSTVEGLAAVEGITHTVEEREDDDSLDSEGEDDGVPGDSGNDFNRSLSRGIDNPDRLIMYDLDYPPEAKSWSSKTFQLYCSFVTVQGFTSYPRRHTRHSRYLQCAEDIICQNTSRSDQGWFDTSSCREYDTRPYVWFPKCNNNESKLWWILFVHLENHLLIRKLEEYDHLLSFRCAKNEPKGNTDESTLQEGQICFMLTAHLGIKGI